MANPTNYNSPFSWRYGTTEMRSIWSEENKHILWRKMWAALARIESHYGLVTPEQVDDIESHIDQINLTETSRIEAEIHHDLMAELKVFNGQCQLGGPVLHLGATSMDIEDNAEALRIREAFKLILVKLRELLARLTEKIDTWADVTVIGFTHLQAAEPTTLGYRLAFTGQDLLEELIEGQNLVKDVRGKGFKGAVGTGAAFADLVGLDQLVEFENALSQVIGLPFYAVTNQTSPRLMEFRILSWLASIAGTLHKFAFDIRLLQSSGIGEVSETFGANQVGSSAMPFKRNPINAEKIDSLARFTAQMPRTAWDNFANSLLERTLDDSANRRLLLPEAFLTVDELLITASRLVSGMRVNLDAVHRNLEQFGPFAATERLMTAIVKKGAHRLDVHERLRRLSMEAWNATFEQRGSRLLENIRGDDTLSSILTPEEITVLLDVSTYTGMAPTSARQTAKEIRKQLDMESTR